MKKIQHLASDPGLFSISYLTNESRLIYHQVFGKQLTKQSRLRPLGYVLPYRDVLRLQWNYKAKETKLKNQVFHSTKKFCKGYVGSNLFTSQLYTISKRTYNPICNFSVLDQRRKKDEKSNLFYQGLTLAGLSLSILGWFVVEKCLGQKNQLIFNPPMFTPFEVIGKETISPTLFLLTLKSSTTNSDIGDEDPFKKWWEKGIWSVEAKQPELQIARSYTPLPPLRGEKLNHLTFLIRKEYKGEMSNYLDQLPERSIVQLRGPNQEVEIPETVNQVLFFAGGTGISPALQVAHQILERRGKDIAPYDSSIHIVWANRHREDILDNGINETASQVEDLSSTRKEVNVKVNPIVLYLQKMKQQYPDQVNVHYFVDEEGTTLTPNIISQLISKESDKYTEIPRSQSSRLILISGPEGFINFIAGAKDLTGIHGCQGQSEIGGVLKNIGLKNWGVWKL